MFVTGPAIDAAAFETAAPVVGCAPVVWETGAPAPWRDRAVALVVLALEAGPPGELMLAQLRREPPRAPCLILLPDDAGPSLVHAAAENADDFAFWPVNPPELLERLRRLCGPAERAAAAGAGSRATDEIASAKRRLLREQQLHRLIGEAPAFRRMVDALPRLAQRDGTVLITGETGTGKELCARALHHLGPRAAKPFLAVDCGALPDHLLENELFGHARGAYTDARTEQRGLVGMADGGVLFLDEVDALSLSAQAKLLRFLQEHSYRPLGSDRLVRAHVRVVAATNADLPALVQGEKFRADLFFRLNVLRVETIPLRHRRGDIALLAEHFVRTLDGGERRGDSRACWLSAAALAKLVRHDWPGNVRELENVILRALAEVDQDTARSQPCEIDASAIAIAVGGAAPESPHGDDESFRSAKARAIAEFERRYVAELLSRHRGNITQAARAAHKDRRALGRLVKKYAPEPLR